MSSDFVLCALSLAELCVGEDEEGAYEEAIELLGEADTLPMMPVAAILAAVGEDSSD